MVKEGKTNTYGRGRGGLWPAPLYKGHRDNTTLALAQEVRAETVKEIKAVEIKNGSGKESEPMETGENVGLEDDDLLIEEGELGVEDYGMEDPSGGLTDSLNQIEDFLIEPEGIDVSTIKENGIGSISTKLLNCSLDNAKVLKTGTSIPKGFQGVNSRKRNIMLLASPRKTNKAGLNMCKQVNMPKKEKQGSLMEKMGRMEGTGQRTSTKKGTVALPKLPAKT